MESRDALPSRVYVPCEQCAGKRYNRETLGDPLQEQVRSPTCSTCRSRRRWISSSTSPKVRRRMETPERGGARLRAPRPARHYALRGRGPAREAGNRAIEGGDEPNPLHPRRAHQAGLHFADVQRLLEVLQHLVDAGNSVVVDRAQPRRERVGPADRLIDMGPEGGEEGGMVVAAGTPRRRGLYPASLAHRPSSWPRS